MTTMRRVYLKALHHEHAVALENQRHPAQFAALAEHDALRKQGFKCQPCPATLGHDFGRALRRRTARAQRFNIA